MNQKIRGGAEATSFERLLNSLAEWFIDNPAPSWKLELAEAGRITQQQGYRY
jgi:hypothetical protein